jgi:hypothetical protein
VIRDISRTFVEVSRTYIEPTIPKIEALASVPDAEWEVRIEELAAWSKSSVTEIRAMAAEADADMGPNLQERVLYLQEHRQEQAIHVAFP